MSSLPPMPRTRGPEQLAWQRQHMKPDAGKADAAAPRPDAGQATRHGKMNMPGADMGAYSRAPQATQQYSPASSQPQAVAFSPGRAQPQQNSWAASTPYSPANPNVASGAQVARPPAFQSLTQNFDGTFSESPNFPQRDAMISQINSQLGQMQAQSWNQPTGAPQFNFPQMAQQANEMVAQGWQNPVLQPPPTMGQAQPIPPTPQGTPYSPALGYVPPTPQNVRSQQQSRAQDRLDRVSEARARANSPEAAAGREATAERERQNLATSEANRQQYRDSMNAQFVRPGGMSDEAFYYLAQNSASGDRAWRAPSRAVYQELWGDQRFAGLPQGPERDLRTQQAYGSFIRHAAPGGARHATDRARAASNAGSLGDARRFLDWRPGEGTLQRRP